MREGLLGQLDVDPSIGWQKQAQLVAAGKNLRAEHAAEFRQDRAQRRPWIGRWPIRPKGVDELVAGHRTVAVENEVCEQQPTLTAGKGILEATSVELEDEPPAQPNLRSPRPFQGSTR